MGAHNQLRDKVIMEFLVTLMEKEFSYYIGCIHLLSLFITTII